MNRTKILILLGIAAAAAGVWFFFFRRKVQAEVYGSTALAGPPTPLAAIAQLQTAGSNAAGQIVQGVAYRALGTVGQALIPNTPQSTPTPPKDLGAAEACPPGFVGYSKLKDGTTTYCTGKANTMWGALADAVKVAQSAPTFAGASYYGEL